MVKRSAQRATLKSLAAELGVSPTTVSNAFNRPNQLAPATRERILNAAARRGFAGPDPAARSLRTRRSGSVGVLLTEDLSYAFEDFASVDFLAGMAAASAGADTSLTLIPAGPSSTDAADAAALVSRAAVDGFVVYSVAAGDPYLEAVRLRGLPAVVCDQPTDTGLPFVGIDNHAAIAPAAQAVISAGHTKIGVLSIRLFREHYDGFVSAEQLEHADMHVQKARVAGVLDECARAGITDVPIVTRHINNPASAASAAESMLDAHPELTALVCTTDSMAIGALVAAQRRGLRVPEDLSVTGFDGIQPALLRGITTVNQENKAKGEAAGRLLAGLIESPESAAAQPLEPTFIETSFVAGTTVAPPRAH